MKQITKVSEPNSLIQHRAKAHSSYDNLPADVKNDLRTNLLAEQGHICCYCMKRIPEKVNLDGKVTYEMKIEHHQCQDNFQHLQLAYHNLLGACMGNEGKPKKLQTCDTKKGNLSLTINPASNNPNCETLFKYNSDGEICSIVNDAEINRQINDILNLNMQTLKDNRRKIYLEVQKRIEAESKQHTTKQLKIRYFEQERNKWLNKVDGKYKEFCMVAVYYLTKKIKQNQRP